jgi:hypothetical protein
VPTLLEPARAIHARVLAHLLARVRAAAACDEPFTHAYFEDLFPADVYAALLAHLPPAGGYRAGPANPNGRYRNRAFYNLTVDGVRRFPPNCRDLWRGVAAALTDPELKRGLYAKLAPDLVYRFRVTEAGVPDLPGHPRPTLYRDTDGFEIPPHPDTLTKVVTMHLYLPADASQLHLGTTLYRPRPDTAGRGILREGFTVAKQFEFRPNSGYAFVVNDSASRLSWHGRERLPAGSGARNTLLNTFYAEPRREYAGYLGEVGGR